jgi:hypothetical protein
MTGMDEDFSEDQYAESDPNPYVQPAQENFYAESELDYESRIIDPRMSVKDSLPDDFGEIKEKLLNFLDVNLSTSNFTDDYLKEVLFAGQTAIALLNLLQVTRNKHILPIYNEYVLEIHLLALALKGKEGWAVTMHRSTFSEASTLETLIHRAVQEKEEEKKKGFFVSSPKKKPADIMQPSFQRTQKLL